MPSSSITALHLLIVQTNEAELSVAEDYLSKEINDLSIHRAETPAHAREILSKHPTIDAVLLGLSHPDTSAETLVKEVVSASGQIPVIVLTEHTEKRLGIKTLSLGISDFLYWNELTPSLLLKSITYSIERRRINNELKQSEEKYRSLFQMSPLPMWLYDRHTYRFLNVNEAAIRHYGYSREEFLNMTIWDLRPPEEHENLKKILTENQTDDRFRKGEFIHRKKNGDIIRVTIQSSSIDLEGRKARLVLATDITEKIIAEQALKTSENRFKALVQEASDLINIIDEDGNYIYVSPAFNSVLNRSPGEFIGRNAFEFVHPDDRAKIQEEFKQLFTQKRAKTTPFRFKVGENEYRWLETIGTNMLDDPAVNGIVINSRDITDTMNHLQAIEEQNTRLREIAWTQSHLVRAPLSRIMGLIELLKNYNHSAEENKELFEHVLKSAYELDDIIRGIVRKAEQVKGESIDSNFNSDKK